MRGVIARVALILCRWKRLAPTNVGNGMRYLGSTTFFLSSSMSLDKLEVVVSTNAFASSAISTDINVTNPARPCGQSYESVQYGCSASVSTGVRFIQFGERLTVRSRYN